MNHKITNFLEKNNFPNFDQIQFSPVPKGSAGDTAISVFAISKSEGCAPVAILQPLQEILKKCDFVQKTEIAGPYLNVFFDLEIFLTQAIQTPTKIQTQNEQKIVIEYSGPNTNKPLHLGHMRNHALGLSLVKLLRNTGATVHPVNIINDRGIHICKSMLAYQKFGKDTTPESENKKSDHFVGNYYVRFESESQKDETLVKQAQEMLQKWEQGDETTRKLWKKMNDWVLTGHTETYARQSIEFEKNYLESEFYQTGAAIAEQAVDSNIFRKREDGAIVFDFEKKGKTRDKVVLRPDGTSVYLTTDLAVDTQRIADYAPDEIVHIVADEQNEHFQILFAALSKLGKIDAKKCHHLGYGLVNLPDGRMKSREGTVVDADNLMDDLAQIATEKIQERHTDMPIEEIRSIAEKIQNAAWKFYLLKTSPKKIITFDAQKSIDFTGATGPYIQYAAVRIQSILAKLPENTEIVPTFTDAEKPLGIKILQWPNVLQRAGKEKNPTYIVTYLIELAQVWSSFYADNSVLKAGTPELQVGRAQLATKILEILEVGLESLGIEIPEKM